ncbi:MAG TPA: diaminopimelate decarboxylase [Polyangiaceae bacterium]
MNSDKAGTLEPKAVAELARQFGTPLYAYDELTIRAKCRAVLAMPNAFGLHVGYAMKANSSRAILQIVASEGLGIDASSINEALRALRAGIPASRIMLTTQDVPVGEARQQLESLIAAGMMYNVCSFRQLELIADCAKVHHRPVAMRVSPGVGSGESATRNTGDKYSSFGIHLANLEQVTAYARQRGVTIGTVHSHIGSGGDPEKWRENIDRILDLTERYFPLATAVNLGGGFKEARMPDESAADIQDLGRTAKQRFEQLAARTGRKLTMVVEPGTYIVANAGHIIASVLDKKSSGPDGFDFLVLDAGMETSTRPLLYGSRHPFYVVSADGRLLSSEFDPSIASEQERVVVGRCCESGDSQTLDDHGKIVPRRIADPVAGDYVVIGGAGAYCSSMTLVGYNSYGHAAEVLVRTDGSFLPIRQRQTLEQLTQNELSLT